MQNAVYAEYEDDDSVCSSQRLSCAAHCELMQQALIAILQHPKGGMSLGDDEYRRGCRPYEAKLQQAVFAKSRS